MQCSICCIFSRYREDLKIAVTNIAQRPFAVTESYLQKERGCKTFLRLAAPRYRWWARTELNCRHSDFQSDALPTELPAHNLLKVL